ncbi:MAG: hypothetical protein LQ342_004276 [Letrouitia transgressa]|nr:MAG: hypothetical protein LQ342_004276 [Letrouitia transgressa]
MTHKRALSDDQISPSKRQLQTISLNPGEFANPPTINDNYIYIVTEEQSGPYLETDQTFREAYATLEDANRMCLIRQKHSDEEDWDNEYDRYGCRQSSAEDGEGNVLKVEVERILVKPPGSVPEDELYSDPEDSHTDTIALGRKDSGHHEN